MLNKLQAVENRFEELEFKSGLPDFYADPKKAAKLLRERNDLEPIVTCYRAYLAAVQEQADAQELMADPEMKELCQQTYQQAKQDKEDLYKQLQILLLPKDPNDEKSVIVVDDIHHSAEMERAWREICADERVTSTMDLYQMGLVFFDKHYWKRHYVMKL